MGRYRPTHEAAGSASAEIYCGQHFKVDDCEKAKCGALTFLDPAEYGTYYGGPRKLGVGSEVDCVDCKRVRRKERRLARAAELGGPGSERINLTELAGFFPER